MQCGTNQFRSTPHDILVCQTLRLQLPAVRTCGKAMIGAPSALACVAACLA